MLGVKLVLGALTFLNALYQSNAATCTAFTSESSCEQTSMCAWSSSTGCYCNVTTSLEVVFVMDSSGSVKDWGWESEKTFVNNVLNTGLSLGSYVGVVEFSDGSEIKHTFSDSQSRSYLTTLVNGLPFLNGYTATLSAVRDAIKIYKDHTRHLPRIMFLITDGNPNPSKSQNPCGSTTNAATARADLATWNITTLLITVGPDINAGTLKCLYGNDPSRVIAANDFTAESLQAIRAKTDAYLCPTSSNIRISEIRVETSTSGGAGGNARFLEVINDGDAIDFGGNNMKLSGYVYGTISTGTLQNGQRLVIYDSSANSDMRCKNCTCSGQGSTSAGTLSAQPERCSNTLYVACGTAGVSCSFNTSMSNTRWRQKIEDTIDKTVWVDVSHDSSTNNLATVYKGYTFEVIDPSQDVSTGTNWKRSCTKYGTPGAKPLTSCSEDCVDEICQSTGDTGASCSENVCSCTAANHYYSDQLQCTLLSPPGNCITYVAKEEDGNQYATVAWTGAGITVDHTYKVVYTYQGVSTETTTNSDTTFTVYGPNGFSTSGAVPTVRTVVGLVESSTVSCPFQTQSPTPNPTRRPTSPPTRKPTNQPTKVPTKQPTKNPTKRPTANPTKKPTKAPTDFPTVSGFSITNCHIVVKGGSTTDITVTYDLVNHTTVPYTQLGLSLELSLDGSLAQRGTVSLNPANGSPQDSSVTDAASHTFYLWPRYRLYASSSASFTTVSNGALCSLTTSQPTPAPTKKPTAQPTRKPTKAPTPKPTGKPSTRPTSSPTYQPVVVESCVVTLGRYDSNGDITSINVAFTEPALNYPTTPDSSNLAYAVSWSDQSYVVKNGETLQNILITLNDRVKITPRIKSPSRAAGPSTNCTVVTQSPTTSPTRAPHAPTASPIKPNIALDLEEDRCSAATKDNNDKDIYACQYEVSQGAYAVDVVLTTGASEYDVTYKWEITFDQKIEPNYELGKNKIAPESDFGLLGGTNTIEAQATSKELSLLIIDKADSDPDNAEVAWLSLTACTFGSNDEYDCDIASAIEDRKTYRIEIVNNRGGKQTSANNKGDLPTWIWYPVAAGVLMLAGLAAFGYMYYNKRKLAEEQLQQKEADLANAEELDNMENFGGLGDNITFNPIATAGTQDVATGGEYIDKQLAKQQKNAEFAQVDVDKEVWRQDFGQIKADRHEV